MRLLSDSEGVWPFLPIALKNFNFAVPTELGTAAAENEEEIGPVSEDSYTCEDAPGHHFDLVYCWIDEFTYMQMWHMTVCFCHVTTT